jgi:HK97 family phage prohead protease
MTEERDRPPRENLVRGIFPVELRDASDPPTEGFLGKTLVGYFARFDEWTEVNSAFEGHFMESLAPGAFRKTIDDQGKRTKVLFNHGQDHSIGSKVIGPAEVLREDKKGGYFEVPMLDTSYNRDLLPGLMLGHDQGGYGTSFRFGVIAEDFNKRPERSDHNPDGLPERIVREARMKEFGPVTFPQYQGASAQARSLTDDWLLQQLLGDSDRLVALLLSRADSKAPYGDVEYADPGYQADKQKRYPIDTKEHADAAWKYINQEDNAGKYSPEDLAKVKAKIKSACAKFGIEIGEEKKSQSPSPLVVIRNPARIAS